MDEGRKRVLLIAAAILAARSWHNTILLPDSRLRSGREYQFVDDAALE